MHAIEVAIDDMCLVVERVVLVLKVRNSSATLIFRIALSGDRLQQIERAAEFLVKDGAGHVVSMLRVAIQKEAAAELVVRLIDRDVAARCLMSRISNAAAASPANPPPTICASFRR